MKSFLLNRKQRIRVNKIVSEWERIATRVLHDAILGPLQFNIFLNDFFLFRFKLRSSFRNDADNNKLCSFGINLKKIKNNLRNILDIVNDWFYKNYMMLNAGKCHFMCLGKTKKNFFTQQKIRRHMPYLKTKIKRPVFQKN